MPLADGDAPEMDASLHRTRRGGGLRVLTVAELTKRVALTPAVAQLVGPNGAIVILADADTRESGRARHDDRNAGNELVVRVREPKRPAVQLMAARQTTSCKHAAAGGYELDSSWPVPGGVQFVTASSGVLAGCGLTGGHELYCWPFGFTYTYYQFVPGIPVVVPGPTGFTGVSVGEYHNWAVGTDELGYCWGESNAFGELGDGKNPQPSSTPSPVQGGIHFRSVTVGEWHSCGLSTSGIVYCWGLNDVSQLGIDSSVTCPEAHPCSPLPTPVSGGLTFKAVTAGTRHTCALTVDGVAYCWGNNTSGQVGAWTTETCGDQYNSFPCATKPMRVLAANGFVEITAGGDHSCGLTATGTVWCWGSNTGGQLGAASADTCRDQRFQPFACSKTPLPAHAELSVSEIRAGGDRTCVLVNRRVYCW